MMKRVALRRPINVDAVRRRLRRPVAHSHQCPNTFGGRGSVRAHRRVLHGLCGVPGWEDVAGHRPRSTPPRAVLLDPRVFPFGPDAQGTQETNGLRRQRRVYRLAVF